MKIGQKNKNENPLLKECSTWRIRQEIIIHFISVNVGKSDNEIVLEINMIETMKIVWHIFVIGGTIYQRENEDN